MGPLAVFIAALLLGFWIRWLLAPRERGTGTVQIRVALIVAGAFLGWLMGWVFDIDPENIVWAAAVLTLLLWVYRRFNNR